MRSLGVFQKRLNSRREPEVDASWHPDSRLHLDELSETHPMPSVRDTFS